MHVAIVVHDFNLNFGQGRYCVEIVRRLAHRCQLTVIANSFGMQAIEGVRFLRVPALRRHAFTTVLSIIPGAELAARRSGCDLIHAQGITCWSADIITGHICNAARAKAAASGDSRSRWFMRLIIPLERAFYRQRRARHLIAISRALEREVRLEYGWNRDSTVIHHGTNSTVFHPPADDAERTRLRGQFRLPRSGWTWLFMGEAVKGLRQAINALVHHPEAHLLVVSRSDFTAYRRQATQLGVAQRVVFHGFEPHPEEAFRAVDVFVYPSNYDPFGMVASEAMATGLPVIVGRDIGAAELVRHGENGLLCDPADDRSLRQALDALRTDPALAGRLGQAGRETILDVSWDHCADRTYAVYEQVHDRLRLTPP